MKISIHTMYFLPDYGSAPILIDELAGYLASKGYEIEVATTMPRQRTAEFRGLFYSVKRCLGFRVKRFWTNATPHPLGRLLAWNIYTAGTILNILTLRKGDIVFLRTPPLQLGLTGFLAKRLKGAKVLLNVQDIHPDLSIESGILKNPLGIRFARALEKWVYGVSNHIIVISEGFRRNLLAKGVPAGKMSVISNWVDTDFLKPLPKDNPLSRKLGLQDKFIVMYSGTISISSNLALERILDAALSLNGEKDILFVVVGEGLKKEGLEHKARGLGLDNVVFLPFQPYDDLPYLLASSDILLVPLDRDKSAISVPSKLYNFMAAGRPILGLTTNDSEVAAVIRETKSGLSVLPDDSEAIGAAILELKADGDRRKTLGANARAYVAEHFAKTMILERYERVMTGMRP